MKNLLHLITALILLSSCKSVKKHNEQISALHSVETLQNDVDKLYTQLKRHHPKLYQYIPKQELDFKFDSLKKTIHKPISSRAFYKKLAPVVASARHGHISLSPAGKWFKRKERKKLLENKFEFYDLDFEFLDDKLWVIANRGKDSTLVGAEVISLSDEPVSKLTEVYKTRFSSDGYNTTLHNRAVGSAFSSFYYKDKGFIDSLKVTFKLNDLVFSRILRRIPKKEKHTEKDSLTIKEVKLPKLSKEEKKANKLARKEKRKKNRIFGYEGERKQYTRNFNFIGQDSAVAYMKIRGFRNRNYKKFYKQSFAKIDSAKTKHFILDLRDNGGGRVSEIDYLYSYLTDKKYQFVKPAEVNSRFPFLKLFMSNTKPLGLKVLGGVLSPIFITQNLINVKKVDDKFYYKLKQSKIRKPKELNYKGKMYVITNGNSFSASSLLSTHLKATKRATFVGEETGGAYNGCVAGLYKIYQLPTSKLKIRIGMMQIEAPHKQTPDGFGIKPDVEVLPNLKDRQSNIDTELDWILSAIYKQE